MGRERERERVKKKVFILITYLFVSSYLTRNDLTYRAATVPLEQVHNYTFKCST